jgi:hypothetical protein
LVRKEAALPQTNDFDRHLCVCVDAQGYGARTAHGQRELQADLRHMLESAADGARLEQVRWQRQDQGDGQLTLIPVGPDEPRVVDDLVRHLVAQLNAYNEPRRQAARMRLRVALHSGVAYPAALGFAGPAVVVVSRLLQCGQVRQALASTHANLVVIMSPTAFEVVEQGHTTLDPALFGRVRVQEKEYRGTAWIWIPGDQSSDVGSWARSAWSTRPESGPPAGPAPAGVPSRNDGVIVSGGVVLGPVAAGYRASAVQQLNDRASRATPTEPDPAEPDSTEPDLAEPDLAELTRQAGALRDLIRALPPGARGGGVVRAVDEIQAAVTAPRPDWPRLLLLLGLVRGACAEPHVLGVIDHMAQVVSGTATR